MNKKSSPGGKGRIEKLLAMLLAVATIFSQIAGNGVTVTATEVTPSVTINGPAEIGLRYDDYTWLFAGETQTFTADVVLEEEQSYTLAWEVGQQVSGEDFVPFESQNGVVTYDIAEDASSITLTGVSAASDLSIRVKVMSSESEQLADAQLGFDVREEREDYFFPVNDDLCLLPDWGFDIEKNLDYYVENPEHPNGDNLTTEITDITVANALDDTEEGDVATISQWEDGNGWNLHANRFGHAIGTITYTTAGDQPEQKQFNIWVGTDVYNLGIRSDKGVDTVLPGESVDLTADFSRDCFNEEQGYFQGSTEGAVFDWLIEDPNCANFVTIEQDG
ncbi:MAG: hypothetical protein ACI4AD_03200, partial [Roseburia sp.]